ncbi:hypothetical protein LQZ19_18275 [Treponema primitia]|uniref:hypothetical protein n=1 Tax=Treponema primitia TaxID=88058 RepID=UPI0039803334
MTLFKKKTGVQPFAPLFQRLNPAEFLFFFRLEYPQTTAFILSFAPNKRYVRKVMNLIKEAGERTQLADCLNAIDTRAKYRDPACIAAMEKAVLEEMNAAV